MLDRENRTHYYTSEIFELLPVGYRIDVKVLLVYSSPNGLGPEYIFDVKECKARRVLRWMESGLPVQSPN